MSNSVERLRKSMIELAISAVNAQYGASSLGDAIIRSKDIVEKHKESMRRMPYFLFRRSRR